MSVSYNRTRKKERLITRIKNMTISEVAKLNPKFNNSSRILPSL